MHKSTIATLGAGDMSNLIAIPPNMNENEWLAVSTEDFFEKINLLYGNVMEVCTAESCPTMSAGPLFEYLWQDNRRYKKATALSAPEYVDCLMEWIQEQMEDESLFPTDPAVPFPKDFKVRLAPLYKRMFRVFGHIYHCHFSTVRSIGMEAHLNTCFKHFIKFSTTYQLIQKKEMAPMQELIDRLLAK
jgi:MOB kinase activator 1